MNTKTFIPIFNFSFYDDIIYNDQNKKGVHTQNPDWAQVQGKKCCISLLKVIVPDEDLTSWSIAVMSV